MKVSDADIQDLWYDMGPGQSDTLGDIVAELRALRKVADAAARLLDHGADPGALIEAIKAAGR